MITLTGDYGYNQFRTSNLSDTEIDASTASWIVSNAGPDQNLYPVLITDSSDVVLTGGVVDGEVPLDLDWEEAYVNSAAVFARDSDDVTFRDWTISEAWDGIRITGEDDATFAVENVWMRNIRDDGIENDRGLSGTISDVLMDGVFVGISLYEDDTGDQTDQTVTLNNVLMRMESFEYKGELTHQPFFKFEDGISPQLSLHDSVFAIDTVEHRELGRLQDAWDSVSEASNNYFLNLSDVPLPDDYPTPPEGFTVLQGAEARAFWEDARDDWLAEFRAVGAVEPEPAPEIDVEPDPAPEPAEVETAPTADPVPASPAPVQEPEPEPEPEFEGGRDDKAPRGKAESKNFVEKIFEKLLSLFRGGGKDKTDATADETDTDDMVETREISSIADLPMVSFADVPTEDALQTEDEEDPFLF